MASLAGDAIEPGVILMTAEVQSRSIHRHTLSSVISYGYDLGCSAVCPRQERKDPCHLLLELTGKSADWAGGGVVSDRAT